MAERKKQIGFWLEWQDYQIVRKLAFDNEESVAGYVKSVLEEKIKKERNKQKKGTENG